MAGNQCVICGTNILKREDEQQHCSNKLIIDNKDLSLTRKIVNWEQILINKSIMLGMPS